MSRGVPASLVTAADFMQVRSALVRLLGGANEALVWTRIEFRMQAAVPPHVDQQGNVWWPATAEQIADETGLSADQVRRALRGLIDDGYLESTEHRLGGNYDRTKSYRTLVQDRQLDLAESRNESWRNRQMDVAIPPALPLPKKEEEERRSGGPHKRGTRIPDPFTVTPDMVAWARERCPLVDGARSTERFINHFTAKTGRDATKLDWTATWRNWLLKDQQDAERAPRRHRTDADRVAEILSLPDPQRELSA